MKVSGQIHAPAALLLGIEPRYPMKIGLDGSDRQSECLSEEILPFPQLVFEPRAVQRVAGRFTDPAVTAYIGNNSNNTIIYCY